MKRKLKRLLKKTLSIVFKALEVGVAFVLITTALAFWRVYTEPVNLKHILPELTARLLPPEAELTAEADSIYLSARIQEDGLFHIDIQNLTLKRPDGTVMTTLPQVEMSYRIWRILTLNYIPNALSIRKPQVHLAINPTGDISPRHAEHATPVNASIKSVVDRMRLLGQLSIEEASLDIEDMRSGEKISLPHITLLWERQLGFSQALEIKAAVLAHKDLMNIEAQAQFNRLSEKMSFEILFDNANLQRFGSLVPLFQEMHLAVRGKVRGILDVDARARAEHAWLKEFQFQIKSEQEGFLSLPPPLENRYDISSLSVAGAFSAAQNQLKIAGSQVLLKQGPVATVEISVRGIPDFLKTSDSSRLQTTLTAHVSDATVSQVPLLWPSGIGSDAHAWVSENLAGGELTRADFMLFFKGGELADLTGDIDVEGARVRYLDPMPPLENVMGKVLLYPDKVHISASSGQLGGIQLTHALLDFTELESETPQAAIHLQARGPVKEVIALISSEPLAFPQQFGIHPEQTGGYAQVDTRLHFPLTDETAKEDVRAQVRASIIDGVLSLPAPGIALTQGSWELSVSNETLDLGGAGLLGALPVRFKMTEFFQARQPTDTARVYEVQTTFSDEQLQRLFPPFKTLMEGSGSGSLQALERVDGVVSGTASFDFEEAQLTLFPLGAVKKKGEKATLSFEGKRESSGAGNIAFSLTGTIAAPDDMAVQGEVSWGAGWTLDLARAQAPATNLTARLARTDTLTDISLRADAWDLTQIAPLAAFLNHLPPAVPQAGQQPPSIILDISLDTLTLADKKPLRDVRLSGRRDGPVWQELSATLQAQEPFALSLNPATQEISGQTQDFGDLMERLNLSPRIESGVLRMKARQAPNGLISGEARAKNFNLKEPRFLLQALTILGIVDAVRGEKLEFKEGVAPFALTPLHELTVDEGYAHGMDLGVTFKGKLTPAEIKLEGSVIPAYAVNSLPGRIPVVGTLFKDGSGGGLLGVRYEVTGPTASPSLTFNPLSSIAPGILGKLFN